jgi:hypothetical protein
VILNLGCVDKNYALPNNRSTTADEATRQNFGEKLSTTALSTEKHIQRRTRRKQTTVWTPPILLDDSCYQQTQKDWDTTRTRSTTFDDTTSQMTTQTPQLPTIRRSCFTIIVDISAYFGQYCVFHCEVNVCIAIVELYMD